VLDGCWVRLCASVASGCDDAWVGLSRGFGLGFGVMSMRFVLGFGVLSRGYVLWLGVMSMG